MKLVLILSLLIATTSYSPISPNNRQLSVPNSALVTVFDDEVTARSAFGTRTYWDDVYRGMGDFPMEEYSWYFGFDVLKPHINKFITESSSILLPGIGNDPILLDLYSEGFKDLVAFDYSEYAIERQRDLLSYEYPDSSVELHHMDARCLHSEWTNSFDVILEKGALDAIYLSGDNNAELSVQEFTRVLKPGGLVISVSGVIPDDLRRRLFSNYNWIRDGTNDLRAGCFIFQKPTR
jgi:SAM-dependent methyltransferase